MSDGGKERPILFSAPMVRALIAGTKTQTRRIVKPRKDRSFGCELAPHEIAGEINSGDFTHAKYGSPGDRLWVRETFCIGWPSGIPGQWSVLRGTCHQDKDRRAFYLADGGDPPDEPQRRWTPSIHMPRWASRITLEIESVRVERLQEISEADAIAEGIAATPWAEFPPSEAYKLLWNAINAEKAQWDANPWVWAVSFRRAKP